MLQNRFYKNLAWLIGISTLLRLVLAATVELGNDEVYYWTYALYPDWSHFDHPPLVGFFIQLFSLNLLFDSEVFIRLSSVIFAGINTWIFFQLGKQIKNELSGWYAALLYTASFYTSIIVGVFILPDTPQVFFWLISLYLMLDILPDKDLVPSSKRKMLLLGLVIGLGIISKHTSVFLWAGAGLYIMFYNRLWFKTYQLYLSVLISLFLLLPVLVWNIENDFISFAYQSERANIFSSPIRFDLLLTEVAGQFFYHNPFVTVLVWIAIWKALFRNDFIETKKLALFLFLSLPILILFLFVALFRQTLPHWSGPAYLALMLIAGAYLAGKYQKKIHWAVKSALALFVLSMFLGVAEVNYGLVNAKKIIGVDLTLDMYGWKQLGEKTKALFEEDFAEGKMSKEAPIISWRWFPAAHLDYYVAKGNRKEVKAIGSLERIHKYAWMNKQRGGFQLGMDAYFITFSNDFEDPNKNIADYFEYIQAPDTLRIERSGKVVKEAYVYRLKNLIAIPKNELD